MPPRVLERLVAREEDADGAAPAGREHALEEPRRRVEADDVGRDVVERRRGRALVERRVLVDARAEERLHVGADEALEDVALFLLVVVLWCCVFVERVHFVKA